MFLLEKSSPIEIIEELPVASKPPGSEGVGSAASGGGEIRNVGSRWNMTTTWMKKISKMSIL